MLAMLLVVLLVHSGAGLSLTTLEARLNTLETQHAALKSKQALHSAHCGYKGHMSTTGRVTYSPTHLTNVGGGTGSSMNTATGTWTAGVAGTYFITWALTSQVYPGEYNSLFLYQNGVRVDESKHNSILGSDSHGYTREQGGRSLILQLARGNTLSLRAARVGGSVHYITFCVSLLHAD